MTSTQMSHSTTATSTYILQKYSKSYPQNPGQPDGGDAGAEWQHFTNPVIRLVLDIKKASSNELESVRVRILWAMNNGNDQYPNEVVFEDLDLLAFSSAPLLQPQKKHAQGLPLKAVYRDSVVGIRYLHPREFNANPTYRRFQITFTSPSVASQFIDAIRTVCPCKANPTTANTQALPRMTMPMPRPSANISSGASLMSQAPVPTSSVPHHPSRLGSLAQFNDPSFLNSLHPARPPLQVDPSRMFFSSPGRPPSSSPVNLDTSTSTSSPMRSLNNFNFSPTLNPNPNPGYNYPGNGLIPMQVMQAHPNPNMQPPRMTLHDMMPDSSPPPPSSSDNSNGPHNSSAPHHLNTPGSTPGILAPSAAQPAQPQSQSAQSELTQQILASISTTSVYGLSPAALEQLVGDVIREDGFVKLMESLDKMWRVKGLVG